MDILRTFGYSGLYGHNDINPRGSDCHITLWKSKEPLFNIPPHSAYPLGVLTRIVSGNILRIHSLCSDKEDTNRCTKDLYVRLLVHGYQRDFMIPAFTKGINGAHAFTKRSSMRWCTTYQDKDTNFRFFFHMTYHPRNPTSKDLQRQWHQHLLHPQWEPPL